jgi:hypothetical protein
MSASTVLMVRPVRFGYNPETAITNTFQKSAAAGQEIQYRALQEFNALVQLLSREGVNVLAIDDTSDPHTPDSIFPNNWISFHSNGSIVLYPMLAANRRHERREDIIRKVKELFACNEIIDLSGHENQDQFLEGTGSIVFDHQHQRAYAALSPRTHRDLVTHLCSRIGYTPVMFTSTDRAGVPVYHTNVVMCVGKQLAVVCLESIDSSSERAMLARELSATGKTVVPITRNQVECFAGNMFELVNTNGDHLLLMSTAAKNSLTPEQTRIISRYCRIIHSPLDTVEQHGGGSARCMIADIRLPRITG